MHIGLLGTCSSLPIRLLLGLASSRLLIFLMIKANGGEEFELPVIGAMARKWASDERTVVAPEVQPAARDPRCSRRRDGGSARGAAASDREAVCSTRTRPVPSSRMSVRRVPAGQHHLVDLPVLHDPRREVAAPR